MHHRALIELVYALFVIVPSMIIFVRTRVLYAVSAHQGIRYFGNAFLSFAVAFSLRFVANVYGSLLAEDWVLLPTALFVLFEYVIALAGFYLVYSLVWKQFEIKGVRVCKSKVGLLHALAILVAVLDFALSPVTQYFLFLSQIIIHGYAIVLSWANYKAAKRRRTFLQIYFIIMVLAFVGWTANFLGIFLIKIFPFIWLYLYGITATIFVLFLAGVLRVTAWRKKERG